MSESSSNNNQSQNEGIFEELDSDIQIYVPPKKPRYDDDMKASDKKKIDELDKFPNTPAYVETFLKDLIISNRALSNKWKEMKKEIARLKRKNESSSSKSNVVPENEVK